LNILIIDDDVDTCRFLEKFLEIKGHMHTSTINSQMALGVNSKQWI